METKNAIAKDSSAVMPSAAVKLGTGKDGVVYQVSQMEAQRCVAVLRDMIEKLDVLSIMSPNLGSGDEQSSHELSQMVSDEISRIIDDQRRLQGRYQDLLTQRSQLKNMTNKVRHKEIQQEIDEVATELRYATKVLTRNLTENPNVPENLMKVQTEREGLRDLLSQLIQELSEGGTFRTLVKALETESRNSEQIKATIAREKQVVIDSNKLKEELHEILEERKREEATQNQAIEKLKEDLQQLKANTTLESKYQRKAALAQSEAARRVYGHTEKLTDQELIKLTKRLEIEDSVHAETNAFLERKHEKLQQMTEYWDAKYEQDMDERERTLNDLKKKKELAEGKLKDLRAKFQEVETLVQKEHRLEEAKKYALEMYQKRTQACLVIQDRYRRYRLRKKAKQQLAKFRKLKKAADKKAKAGAKK